MTPNKPIPPETLGFARRLKELTAGETQADIARRLGFTASYISQVHRGQRPSRHFVERVVEAYGVDREEWLRYANFRPAGEEQEDERMDIARRASEETIRRLAAPPLERIRLAAAELDYEPDLSNVRIRAFEGWDQIPPEDLEIIEDVMRALIAEERRKRGN